MPAHVNNHHFSHPIRDFHFFEYLQNLHTVHQIPHHQGCHRASWVHSFDPATWFGPKWSLDRAKKLKPPTPFGAILFKNNAAYYLNQLKML
jgi:hypothetical protein